MNGLPAAIIMDFILPLLTTSHVPPSSTTLFHDRYRFDDPPCCSGIRGSHCKWRSSPYPTKWGAQRGFLPSAPGRFGFLNSPGPTQNTGLNPETWVYMSCGFGYLGGSDRPLRGCQSIGTVEQQLQALACWSG